MTDRESADEGFRWGWLMAKRTALNSLTNTAKRMKTYLYLRALREDVLITALFRVGRGNPRRVVR
jgi:hypothetical protein